jgi:hypothetical protein
MDSLDWMFFGLLAVCVVLLLMSPRKPYDGIGMKLTRTKCFDWPDHPV